MKRLETICTWKWRQPGYRSIFTCNAVNALYKGVKRFYAKPHRFVCFTDDAEGLDKGIEALPCPSKWADVLSPHGRMAPSCYRRLWLFGPDAGAALGSRFLSLDLDCVVTGDLGPLLDRDEDFMMWGDTSANTAYNGSMVLMDAGARLRVYETFNPLTSPRLTYAKKMVGSDQAWISHVLGPNEPRFGVKDGVYSFRLHLDTAARHSLKGVGATDLPSNARLVFFHGRVDPWDPRARMRHPWIKEFHDMESTP